ncbi:DUF2807 domain-containing protein [Duganella sp. FT50W]|uniref:DUF2807 domain-containing protein n=1 Tax=Duganella lactea TaxID=2692173 RepID=A0A6L8MI28_9BURK|nr:DUF2807 domain-containing protein [Duganella lactea]MYM82757.1 DUF2807 domain-containing protein [Duganella lactea]
MRRSPAALPLGLIICLIACLSAGLLAPHAAGAADSERQVAPFIAIHAKGAFAMTVEVGRPQSLRISGEERFLAAVQTTVVDNELRITLPEKTYTGTQKDPRITISVPSLSRVKVEGAGETVLHQLRGERVDIGYLGAGRLAADGKVKYLRLNARGVGEVDAGQLQAERVDVNFEGLGNVSVRASVLLNAVAKGIGNLTYYGHPPTVNQSVSGIGNVKAGD